MAIRVDTGQLADPELLTDSQKAGVPVSGGQNTGEGVQGDGSVGAPIELDINGLTQEFAVEENSDFVAIYDVSAGEHKKVLLADLIPGVMQLVGEIDASTTPPFPSTPDIGDAYVITVAGTVGGIVVENGDLLLYSASGWFVLQRNMEVATQADMEIGTDNAKYSTAARSNPNNYTTASAIVGTEEVKFWSPTDNAVVKDTLSNIISGLVPPSTNIYNADGSLTGDRDLDGAGFDMIMSNIENLNLESNDEMFLEAGSLNMGAQGFTLTGVTSGIVESGRLIIQPNGTQGTAGDILVSTDTQGTVEFVDPSTITSVIMSPTAARVTPNGNDSTGQVGRFDLPFATVSAALTVVPALTGIVYVEDGQYNETIAGNQYNVIHLRGARLTGNITSTPGGVVNITSTRGIIFTENIVFPFGDAYVGTISVDGGSVKVYGLQGFKGNIDSPSQYFLRNINVLDTNNGIGIVTGTAYTTFSDAAIEDIGSIFLRSGDIIANDPFTGTRIVRISNVNKIRKSGGDTTSGLIGNIDGDTTVILSNCPITEFGGDIIKGATTTGDPRVLIINSNAKSANGSLVDVSGVANSLEVLVSSGSSVDVDSAEAINWAGNPSNKVTLKAYPGSASNKDWNNVGVIDLGASSDYSTIDSNLQFDFIV